MRMILMTVSLLIVSFLIFQGYPGGMGNSNDAARVEAQQMDPQRKAADVNRLIEDAASLQKQQLQQQTQ